MTTLLTWEDSGCSDYWIGYKCLSCKNSFQYDILHRILRKRLKDQSLAPGQPKFCPCCGEQVKEIRKLQESTSRVPHEMRGKSQRLDRLRAWSYVVKSKLTKNEFSEFSLVNTFVEGDWNDPLRDLKIAQSSWKHAIGESEKLPWEVEIALIAYPPNDPDIHKQGLGKGRVLRKIIKGGDDLATNSNQ